MATHRPLTAEELRRIVGGVLFYAGISSASDGHVMLRGVALIVGLGLWVPTAVRASRAERLRSSVR